MNIQHEKTERLERRLQAWKEERGLDRFRPEIVETAIEGIQAELDRRALQRQKEKHEHC